MDWRLLAITGPDGVRHDVARKDHSISFDGEGHFYANVCNSLGGNVEIAGAKLTFSKAGSTAMLCVGGDEMAVEGLVTKLVDGVAAWSVTKGRLHLEGSGVRADLYPLVPPWPRSMNVLLESAPGTFPQFQVGWAKDEAGIFLHFHGRSKPGTGWAAEGGSLQNQSVDNIPSLAHVVTLGDVMVLFGGVPRGTQRVEFRPTSGSPIPLRVFTLPGDAKAFAGAIRSMPRGVVVALGEGGKELDRSKELPGP